MPDSYAYVAKDANGQPKYGWDGAKWVPIASQLQTGAMQKKPGGPILQASEQIHPIRAIPPTILQSFGIDPAQVEGAKGTIDALKAGFGQAASETGEQAFESMVHTGPLAPVDMLRKGIEGVANGIEEGSRKAYASYQNGDRYGLTQGLTQVVSSLGQLALMKEAKPAVEKSVELTGKGVRGVARMPVGIGGAAEQFERGDIEKAAAGHAAEVKKIEQDYNLEKRAFDKAKSGEAIYRTEKAPSEVTREARGRVAQGPVKQRLMNFSDRVGEVADKTKASLKDSFNKRYDAFRKSLQSHDANGNVVEPVVNWSPVQEAVKNAEENILQGSPESLNLFRNIMKEGPQLDEATVFRTSQRTEAAQNLKEMMQSRFMDEATKRRIEAQLTAQGIPLGAVREAGTITEGLQIPHKDAWGYAQELNAKLHGAQLPSDVYRALTSVKEAVDEGLQETADKKKAGPAWKQIQQDYSEYAQRFLDKDSPAYRLLNSTNPEDRLAIITGKEGQNLIDILHKYRGFGGDTEIAGKTRALQAAAQKTIPEITEPKAPTYPRAPEAFSPEEWHKQRLREYQERLAMRQPTTMWQFMQLPYFRAMSQLYSNPAFVKLILGIK